MQFLQGQAESYLERLHGVTEKELETLAKEETKVSMEDWAKFRERLIGLTDVTKSHFEKLVQVGFASHFVQRLRTVKSLRQFPQLSLTKDDCSSCETSSYTSAPFIQYSRTIHRTYAECSQQVRVLSIIPFTTCPFWIFMVPSCGYTQTTSQIDRGIKVRAPTAGVGERDGEDAQCL